MPVLIAIPARYASTRYPGKPLVELRGAGRDVQEPDPAELGRGDGGAGDRPGRGGDRRRPYPRRTPQRFGAEVVMTSADCRNGTERCAEVLRQLPRP